MRQLYTAGDPMRMAESATEGTTRFTSVGQPGTKHYIPGELLRQQSSADVYGNSTPSIYT